MVRNVMAILMLWDALSPSRYASSVGFKTSVSVNSGAGQDWCLVSSGDVLSGQTTENHLEISVVGQLIRLENRN